MQTEAEGTVASWLGGEAGEGAEQEGGHEEGEGGEEDEEQEEEEAHEDPVRESMADRLQKSREGQEGTKVGRYAFARGVFCRRDSPGRVMDLGRAGRLQNPRLPKALALRAAPALRRHRRCLAAGYA